MLYHPITVKFSLSTCITIFCNQSLSFGEAKLNLNFSFEFKKGKKKKKRQLTYIKKKKKKKKTCECWLSLRGWDGYHSELHINVPTFFIKNPHDGS